MLDPVSLSLAAGVVWIGDKLIKDFKDKYSPTSIHTVPKVTVPQAVAVATSAAIISAAA